MADVEVPKLGKVPKKPAILIVGAAAAYVGWRWFHARSTGTGAVPVPVDTANTAAGAGVTGYSNPGGIAAQADTGTGAPGDNQAWTAKAETDLSALGYDPQTVAAALAAYLASQPLTLDQQNIVRLAWAFEGKPPQNTNLAIIPAQTPAPAPVPTPEPAPAPAPVPADPHAGQHLQPPQVATLVAGRTLRDLAKGLYGTSEAQYGPHLAILVALNPGEGGPDHKAVTTHQILTSAAHYVPN